MKLAFDRRHFPFAAVVFLSGAAVAVACSTTAVTPDAGTSGTASGASGAGATGSVTGSSTTGTTGTAGTATGTSGASGTGPVACVSAATTPKVCTKPGPTDAGYASIINFMHLCTEADGGACTGPNYDGGTTDLALFTNFNYPSLYGGTFPPFGPSTDSVPDDSGVGCTTFGSQDTFGTTLDTTAGTWNWAGLVTGYTGDGFYIGGCLDASQYSGIQFGVYGTVGAPNDGGTSDQVTLQVSQLDNWNVASAGGCCLAADGGAGTNCNPATYSFSVPATPGTVIQVPWSALTGGGPDPLFDPSHIIQVQWQLPWSCSGSAPYNTNITFTDVGLYQ